MLYTREFSITLKMHHFFLFGERFLIFGSTFLRWRDFFLGGATLFLFGATFFRPTSSTFLLAELVFTWCDLFAGRLFSLVIICRLLLDL